MTEPKGNPKLPPAKKIAVFGASKVLVAQFRSMRTASDICRIDIGNISKACSGMATACNGYYWRVVPADIELVEDDFNNTDFTVIDFDKLVGNEDRNYKKFKSMNRSKAFKKRGDKNGRKK